MSDTHTTTIDLLRHGRCEGGEIFRGSTDVALTDDGWSEMQAALQGEGRGWSQVVSSPLQRCRLFAEQWAAERTLPLEVEPRLREIHFGEWEGVTHVEVGRRYPDLLQRFWVDPEQATPPGGELITDFRDRVTAAAEQLLARYQGEHLLLVTHGAVIRVLMCHWLSMPLTAISNISVPYAGFTRFRVFQQAGAEPWVQLISHRGGTAA